MSSISLVFPAEFDGILEALRIPYDNGDIRGALQEFYKLVLRGNQTQNLTRITDPSDFVLHNVFDCLELIKSGWLKGVRGDYGSGFGVPGIICSIIEPHERWILFESEGRKADFIDEAVRILDLKNCLPVKGRAEKLMDVNKVETVVVRAVGSVSKTVKSISKCSTWNRVVMLKGAKLGEELREYSNAASRDMRGASVETRDYSFSEVSFRNGKILKIERVPRGT